MARTKKSKKAIGYDFWSRRPGAKGNFGPVAKKLTHRAERALDKRIEHKALKEEE